MVNSKGKILAIALGALALFVGGVAVATAEGPAPVTDSVAQNEIRLSVPELGIMPGCSPPPGQQGCGPG